MSNIKFEVNSNINTAGIGKRGTIKTTYRKIVSVFGEGDRSRDNNTFNEWSIQFEAPDDEGDFDYVIATIYDWMEDTDPRQHVDNEYVFNIGGISMDSAYYVHHLLSK